ncbi:magnesium-translocating P-type ATPase [Paraflavitalea soli]|uniref:magnesium-translocating P-type ATPase n=1 Tax=Paraflavitalea soli TaxID=2315862 RepID=UPI001FEB195A|nr:magnesium-translocating P-type ATPase [Paraflavitalea soli]
MEIFWDRSGEEAIQQLSTSTSGLSLEEADIRLKEYGPNSMGSRTKMPGIVLFLAQFKSPVTILLVAASCLSIILGDLSDAAIILFIIFISSGLGYWQERGAANAINELLKMVQLKCLLLRNGTATEQPVERLVPGDIVILSAGDIIPGDCLLLESNSLFIDEATFTGETYPVEKMPCILPANTPLAGRTNALFMGSYVISGKATALIVKTGRQTELGKISGSLRLKKPETDFEKGIRHFGYLLMEITLVLVFCIFAINILLHKPALDSFLFSLALAVGLTPQLLPAIVSVNLAVGARAMARKRVIVKRLSAIENFGSMNILCSDKTGTITQGKVVVKDALDLAGNHSPKTLRLGWLNASFQQGFQNPLDQAICNNWQGSLAGICVEAEIPYDFIRKRLTIQVADKEDHYAITKGALQCVIDICNRVETADGQIVALADQLDVVLEKYEALSKEGLRVLGVAYKPMKPGTLVSRQEETDMIFIGFITLYDPPKDGIVETIGQLRDAGVQLKLITGDNALVAESLARQIGIAAPVVLTGAQLRSLSDRALLQQVSHTDIFAALEPNQKERIIVFLKRAGHVVGFLGDGINDAPALHAADVGISVDTAVDVARQAADIVLLDHDLNTLLTGVIEGRKTFANTMKYIFMATSANFGNMFSMAGASLFLGFLPLLPKQLLITNLLTDFPEMAIAYDRVDAAALRKPLHWDLGFIKRFMIVFGLLSSVFDYLTFFVLLYLLDMNEAQFQTGWFVESVISAALIVLVVRTRRSFLKNLPGKALSLATGLLVLLVPFIPFLPFAGLLGFTRLSAPVYGWLLLVIVAYILSAEMVKHLFYRKKVPFLHRPSSA